MIQPWSYFQEKCLKRAQHILNISGIADWSSTGKCKFFPLLEVMLECILLEVITSAVGDMFLPLQKTDRQTSEKLAWTWVQTPS